PMGAALAVLAMAMVTAVAVLFLVLNRRYLRGRK
ncbi:ABC transporter permease, partial [Rhodovulum sulfidophilum]|nr:ABC transporter permease [Rhodovulum sulfidophilum]